MLDLDQLTGAFSRRKSTISLVGAPGVNTSATLALELLRVLARDRPADDDQHVFEAVLAQPVDDLRDQRHVGARQDRDPHRVGVLLDRGLDDLLGRLAEAV